jgi:hypothetical protein
MATFASTQDFTVSQSADCTTLTFTDISNYTSNDEGWVIGDFTDRKFLIYNSDGVLVDTIELGLLLTATYTLTVDKMLSVTLSCTPPTGPALLKTHSVLSTCFLQLCFAELVANTECGCGGGSCGCSSGSCENVDSDKLKLLQYIKAADIFAEYSNPVLAQKQLDAGQLICEANTNN